MTHLDNPFGAHRTVTTFASGKDRDGEPFHQPASINNYRANAAITRGQVVSFVVGTATVPLSVKPMATADSGLIFAGVALNDAAAGESVQVANYGHVLVLTGDITTALGEYLLKPATTAGTGTVANTAIDATTVAGTILGIVVGPEADNLTPVFLTRF